MMNPTVPACPEIEMRLLGILLVDPKQLPDISASVRPDDLWQSKHATIFATMEQVYADTGDIDMNLLVTRLRDTGVLDQIGGVEYLIELGDATHHTAGIQHLVRTIREKSQRRHVAEAAEKAKAAALDESTEHADMLNTAEQAMFQATAQDAQGDRTHSIGSLAAELVARAERGEKPTPGVKTGLCELDSKLRGMRAGQMLTLAARPSVGKSSIAMNMAEGAAIERDEPTAIISLEMSAAELRDRLLVSMAGISADDLQSGRLDPEAIERLRQAAASLHDAPLYISDPPELTISSLRSKARRLVSKFGIRLLIIDYLQLIRDPATAKESKYAEATEVSRAIKGLASELEIPILALSQLNRMSEQRADYRPRMADLRQTGAIEQDSDVVMLLHREDFARQDDKKWLDANPDKIGKAELIIAKNRAGATGVIELHFEPASTRFAELSQWEIQT